MKVYMIVNNETLLLYIGQHGGVNLQKYLQTKFSDAMHGRGGKSRLYNSMRIHSKYVWSIHPLLEVSTKAELDSWEEFYIKLFHAQDPAYGYNICKGGECGVGRPRGHEVTAATRAKISASHMGMKHTIESKAKISAVQLGKIQSPELIEKRIAPLRGRKRDCPWLHTREVTWGGKIAAAKRLYWASHQKEAAERMASLRARKKSD